ncbi:MAG: hypothetical protein JJT87_06185 [Halomonas sp.]|nr:hypothetical protein [Halomonas sp.]MCC5901498.1 hypothetical protein [Halomonas sp.]
MALPSFVGFVGFVGYFEHTKPFCYFSDASFLCLPPVICLCCFLSLLNSHFLTLAGEFCFDISSSFNATSPGGENIGETWDTDTVRD